MGKTRSGSVVSCEKCGIPFRAWRSDRPSRFCSTECAPHGRPAKTPSTKCATCGVLFRRFGGGHPAKYCSRDCYRSVAKTTINDGYVLVYAPNEPGAYDSGQIREHRYVMQNILGRPLASHETIHHIDGDKTNNIPSNLQLRTGRHGNGIVMHCAECGSHNIVSAPLAAESLL